MIFETDPLKKHIARTVRQLFPNIRMNSILPSQQQQQQQVFNMKLPIQQQQQQQQILLRVSKFLSML